MSMRRCIALVPRDGLFCKDGRGWHTSASGRGHGLDWPWPSTVLGALRSAWGRSEEDRTRKRFGPDDWKTATASIALGSSLTLRRRSQANWSNVDRVWAAPMDAICFQHKDNVVRLDPVPPRLLTLGRDEDDAREALWVPFLDETSKPSAPARWWSDARFLTWLAGGSVSARDGENTFESRRRVQAHVGIRAELLTADEGVLFSHDVLETLERGAEWAIGIEANFPGGELPSIATLGSDGRLATIETVPPSLFEPPDSVLDSFRQGSLGLRLIAVSPTCFHRGWLPDGFERVGREYRGTLPGIEGEIILRAAIVARPIHISGWDMVAGSPKPTSRMVPPGSVYFFERADGRPVRQPEARGLWLAPIGSRTNEGFGRVVPGIWSPIRSKE